MNKSFTNLLLLLAIWHATNDCKRLTCFDDLMRFYRKIVEQVPACTDQGSTANQEGLLDHVSLAASFEMLLAEGLICHAQAG